MPIAGLGAQKLAKLRESLGIIKVDFITKAEFDEVHVLCQAIYITISSEGTIILQLRKDDKGDLAFENAAMLEHFFIEKLSPAVNYLFSLGAPLPKELQNIREAYPTIVIVKDAFEQELNQFIKTQKIEIYSRDISEKLDFFFGEKTSIINVKHDAVPKDILLQEMIFLKEFPMQLKNYLAVHRMVWEKVDNIREVKSIAYKDFTRIREQMNGFLKTLSLMKARLAQMEDIIETKKEINNAMSQEGLKDINIHRINNFIGDVKYVKDLWEMTIDYVKDTLNLIESVSRENIQRELSALKFVALIGAITSFFGMNIAFPWEDRWDAIFLSSLAVIGIIIFVSFTFYYFLKIFIYNRKFNMK